MPQGASLVIGLRQLLGAGEQLAVALAQPHPFDGQQRVRQCCGEFHCGHGNLCRRSDGNDHQWNIDVAAEEPGPAAPTVCRAVDAEQHCGTCESMSMQKLADGVVGRRPGNPHLAAGVDGELGGISVSAVDVAEFLGAAVPGDQSRPFQGHQAAVGHRCDVVDQGADFRFDVDGGDGHRRVLGQAQRLIAAKLVLWPETGGTAQHHAGRDVMGAEQIQHRIGQKPPRPADSALPLAEIRGQLQALLVHIWAIH